MRHVSSCSERADCLAGSNGLTWAVGRACVRIGDHVVSRVRMCLLARILPILGTPLVPLASLLSAHLIKNVSGQSCFLVDSPQLLIKVHYFLTCLLWELGRSDIIFSSTDYFYTKSSDFILEIHIGSHLHSKQFHFHTVCTYSLVAGLGCNQFIVLSESKRTTWSVSSHDDIMLN